MQIKTILRYYHTPIGMLKIKKGNGNKCLSRYGERGASPAGESANWRSRCGNQCRASSKPEK